MYGLQHGALAHIEQQAIKSHKITSVKPFKRENQRSNLYKIKKKRETRINYIQTTTTVHQIPDLGQVQTFVVGLAYKNTSRWLKSLFFVGWVSLAW